VEGLAVNPHFWKSKRVFLTGHTGFKGGWLALWLHSMGAHVHGYALSPPTDPSLFTVARVEERMANSKIADVQDARLLRMAMQTSEPDIVIHLAAQPLVRFAYREPVETYAVNVMGTINVLEAIRNTPSVRAVVVVTTDKCYKNREWIWAYREDEPMGGHDPYSSSKACVEILTDSWRQSFFSDSSVAVATARAGNVIGGGDWAADRLIPDFLKGLDQGETLQVRSPEAIRPWQHVLEPLSGYLKLAEHLFTDGCAYAEAWNFGPTDSDCRSVHWIVERLVASSSGASWACQQSPQPHEACTLKLDSSKARMRLGWRPRWPLETALAKTLEWHINWRQGKDMQTVTLTQIAEYTKWDPAP
jgi:CDP-glucose 4,6-dehydratase